MKLNFPSAERGIALIMVLIMVVVLGILAGGFAYSMKVETKLARNASFDAELEVLGRAGVELARYVLAQSMTGPGGQFDSLHQKWAGGTGDTNDFLSDVDLKNYQLGDGTISLTIEDLDRKFNINVADEVILRQALTLIGVDAADSPTIIDSILDWRDPDDDSHPNGAEDSYYQTLAGVNSPIGGPYFAKNGPFDDMSELLLVKGVSEAMYKGSSGGGHGAIRRQNSARKSRFEEPTYAIGFKDLFTTISSRLVNINTASAEVLQVFPEIDENVAQAIIAARNGIEGATAGTDAAFRSVQELGRVPGINPAAVAQFSRYFTVRSLIFQVSANVQIGGNKRQYVALLRRNNPRDVQILNMYWGQ